jgi:2,4-dienoyl-CoA reductase-like NADH-dependent reductase (Old Yellow Enzyme family)
MITEAELADRAIREEQADVIMLAREMLRDPYWPYHAAKTLGAAAPGNILPVQYARAVS